MTRFVKTALLPCALMILLATVLASLMFRIGEAKAASPHPLCRNCNLKNSIAHPNYNDIPGAFNGTAAISSKDVWAVGYGLGQTLTEHWNGKKWTIVSSPNPVGATRSVFSAAAAIPNTNQVWAVGYYNKGNVLQTLIEHWDGTSWNVIASPNVGSIDNLLTGVAAVSPNDSWAVGSYGNSTNGPVQTLIEHWNGTGWSVVPSPGVQSNSALTAITAISANDVWAVGYYGANLYLVGAQTLTEHWDGTNWSVVPSSNPGSNSNILYGITAVSSNNIWAVGYYGVEKGRAGLYIYTLIEHWDGTSWSVISSPNSGQRESFLYSVVQVPGTTQMWAVGYYDGSRSRQSLIEFWNGTNWSVIPSSNPEPKNSVLLTVAAVSAGDVWALGDYLNLNSSKTLTEHWNGTNWKVIASPNPMSPFGSLQGLAFHSSSDIWAVGDSETGNISRPSTEHWNGTNWSLVSTPGHSGTYNQLHSVVRVPGTTEFWAVGFLRYTNGSPEDQTLTELWNGTKWNIIPSPNPGSRFNYLYGVAAASANDAWAVGDYIDNNGIDQPLIEHWDGTSWSVISNPGSNGGLSGVAKASANDVWAVGEVIEHWNGTSWSIVPGPNPPSGTTYFLQRLAVASMNDVWAVGDSEDSNFNNSTLIEHWDGVQWNIIPSPSPGPNTNYLSGVTAISTNNTWAVGSYYGSGSPTSQTLIEHWDGTSWSVVPSPSPGSVDNGLSAVKAIASASNIWAIGYAADFDGSHRLIEHWDGISWSVVPGP